jgi:hypothetical protein
LAAAVGFFLVLAMNMLYTKLDMRHFWALFLLGCTTATQKPAEPLAAEVTTIPDYNRAEYGSWIDSDKDCQNTRAEVLISESRIQVTFTDTRNCTVATGEWFDPYNGLTYTSASYLDVDHFVPLEEAHESGGYAWDSVKKKAYANFLDDPAHLIAVSSSTNRSKGSRDPALWMPPQKGYWCEYLKAWVGVKVRWGLEMDCVEARAIAKLAAENCKL